MPITDEDVAFGEAVAAEMLSPAGYARYKAQVIEELGKDWWGRYGRASFDAANRLMFGPTTPTAAELEAAEEP